MESELNQLYVAINGLGQLHQGQHVATFKDGTAHLVTANIAKHKENFRIKTGPQIHLYEYIDLIEPICLNETGLIKALPCPQCGSQDVMIANNRRLGILFVKCGNCPLQVEDDKIVDINKMITIWNNIPRWEIIDYDVPSKVSATE